MPPTTAPEGREYRYLTAPVELRADGDVRKLVGHAAVFDTDTPIGPSDRPYWVERVQRGAFRNAIVNDDVRALFNHDANVVLGRNRSGTLKLSEDDVGLLVEITPPDTVAARDVVTLVERGDVSQMSFGFMVRTGGQMWEELPDGSVRRTVKDVILFDVSPVTFPAFPTTDLAVREARAAGLIGADAIREQRDRDRMQRNRNLLALADATL